MSDVDSGMDALSLRAAAVPDGSHTHPTQDLVAGEPRN